MSWARGCARGVETSTGHFRHSPGLSAHRGKPSRSGNLPKAAAKKCFWGGVCLLFAQEQLPRAPLALTAGLGAPSWIFLLHVSTCHAMKTMRKMPHGLSSGIPPSEGTWELVPQVPEPRGEAAEGEHKCRMEQRALGTRQGKASRRGRAANSPGTHFSLSAPSELIASKPSSDKIPSAAPVIK